MIKIIPDPTFSALTKLTVPGRQTHEEISVTFRHKTQEGMAAWFEASKQKLAHDALDEIITNWGEPYENKEGELEDGKPVIGPDGLAVPYTKEALKTLLSNYVPATAEIIRAWQIQLNESRIKN